MKKITHPSGDQKRARASLFISDKKLLCIYGYYILMKNSLFQENLRIQNLDASFKLDSKTRRQKFKVSSEKTEKSDTVEEFNSSTRLKR